MVREDVSEKEVMRYLLEGTPSVYVMSENAGSFFINPMCLDPGEVEIVIEKLNTFTK